MSNDQEHFSEPGQDNEEMTTVRVGCYAGYRAEESPQRFFLGAREVKVVEIIDRWLDPACSYFKVRGNDNGIYILRYTQDSGAWDMLLFSSGTRDESRLSST
jgi:hypothetical protein